MLVVVLVLDNPNVLNRANGTKKLQDKWGSLPAQNANAPRTSTRTRTSTNSQSSEFGFKLNFHPLRTEITCKHNTRIARDGRAARSKFSQVPVTVQSEVKDSTLETEV